LIVDPDNSKNFDLPEHYINELVSEIVKMIGVRLRDTTLTSYGLQQTQAE
jgi:Fe2+ or Zn2+ uptake regulation protein